MMISQPLFFLHVQNIQLTSRFTGCPVMADDQTVTSLLLGLVMFKYKQLTTSDSAYIFIPGARPEAQISYGTFAAFLNNL